MEYKAPALAELLEVDPKRLRDFLREEFPQDAPGQGGEWVITLAMAVAATRRFG